MEDLSPSSLSKIHLPGLFDEAVNKTEQRAGEQAGQRIRKMFSAGCRHRLAANFGPLSAFEH